MTSEEYWNKNKGRYKYFVEVPHMSAQDLDPAKFKRHTREHFLRVPFKGVAHWAFYTYQGAKVFKDMAGVTP